MSYQIETRLTVANGPQHSVKLYIHPTEAIRPIHTAHGFANRAEAREYAESWQQILDGWNATPGKELP